MQSIYKYRFSRRTIYVSIIYLIVFVLLGWLLYHLYEGGYLSAWFTSFIVALIALMALSIPRKIVVMDDRVEIRCLLDITEIRRNEIASVRRVENRRMKWFLPIFGGYGFFGYYGHFLDLRRLDRVRIYASEWRNFVEITDIYEDRLYVSCTEADRLVAELMPPGGNRLDEEEEEEEEEEEDENLGEAEPGHAAGAEETAGAEEAAGVKETAGRTDGNGQTGDKGTAGDKSAADGNETADGKETAGVKQDKKPE